MSEDKLLGPTALDLETLRSSYFDRLSQALDRFMRSPTFMSCVQCCLTAMNRAKSMQSRSFDMLYEWDSTRRQWQALSSSTNQGDQQ
jgi:hypothetical protein